MGSNPKANLTEARDWNCIFGIRTTNPYCCAGKAALLEGMAALGESGRWADVVLVAGSSGARLPARRCVLAMRSHVFKRMWRQEGMVEVGASIAPLCRSLLHP